MSVIYAIKPSPDKGLGVFANTKIEPGTIIFQDKVLLKLTRPEVDLPKEQVDEAFAAHALDLHKVFSGLSTDDQTAVLQLHQGHEQRRDKLYSIFWTNCYRRNNCCILYHLTSRLNHSCEPNAEIADVASNYAEVVAIREIAKDEEILVSYGGGIAVGSKEQRIQLAKELYVFECRCSKCTMHGNEAILSDARRQLLCAITTRQEGFEPVHLHYSSVWKGIGEEKQRDLLTRPKQRLAVPLNPREKVAYGFMKAKLLESEGLVGIQLCNAYLQAATELLLQVLAWKSVVMISSINHIVEWSEAGIRAIKSVRGPDSNDVMKVQRSWDQAQRTRHVAVGMAFIADPHGLAAMLRREIEDVSAIVAIELVRPGRFLTQNALKTLLEAGELA